LFIDSLGNTLQYWRALPAFVSAVDSLPLVFQDNVANGPLYCATYCHGGSLGSMPTTKMSLSALLEVPRDDAFACANMRQLIAPGDVEGSDIIKMTKPGNSTGHLFSFQGNFGSHDAYTAKMTPWIEAE
jgi:hypothetical protein